MMIHLGISHSSRGEFSEINRYGNCHLEVCKQIIYLPFFSSTFSRSPSLFVLLRISTLLLRLSSVVVFILETPP